VREDLGDQRTQPGLANAPIKLVHNLTGDKFVWLWAKYVSGVNDQYHCTNCIRGPYSKMLSKHNPDLPAQREIVLDEVDPNRFKAIYICGVSNNGYSRKANYDHNLHAAVLPKPGQSDRFTFESWRLSVENGLFLPIPKEEALPKPYCVFHRPSRLAAFSDGLLSQDASFRANDL